MVLCASFKTGLKRPGKDYKWFKHVCSVSATDQSSIYMTASYEELIKSWKKLEKVGTIEKKSFI